MTTVEEAHASRAAVTSVSELPMSGTIAPTRLSVAYRLGLVVVTLAMLVLPVLYLGIIAAAGTMVWWHLTTNTWILGGSFSRVLLYAAPAVAGLVVVLFMIKPMLARATKQQDPVPLVPETEPRLFAFIEQICGQVRAPIPRRVQVDCRVNASASFLRGGRGLLSGNLVLTIGLPLVAGLTTRQLGGVLAHEFGHFAQGGGMRLTALVRGINGWFARVVYERDEWDEKLSRWSKEADWRLNIVLLLAVGAVWLSRKVLTGLMMAGHAVSCFMLRQMEYDADSYEVKFAGSAAFASTVVRLRELNLATSIGYDDLQAALARQTVPANLPAYLVDMVGRIPEELLAGVRQPDETATRWSDTHPADASRVRAAEAIAQPGVLVGGGEPAVQLFDDFDALSAAVTRHHYVHDLGLALGTLTFAENDTVLDDSRRRADRANALRQFFGEHWSGYRPLRITMDDGSPGVGDCRERSLAAGARMTAAAAALTDQYARVEWLEGRRSNAFAAQELLSNGFGTLDPAEFDLATGTLEDAVATQGWALEEQQVMVPVLDAFEETVGERLSSALGMLDPLAPAAVEAADLVGAFNPVAGAIRHTFEMRHLALAATLLRNNVAASAQPDQTHGRVAELERQLAAGRNHLRDLLSQTPCPASLASTATSIAAHCGLLDAGGEDPLEAVRRVWSCYFELLGRITVLAVAAEEERAAVQV